MRPAISFVLLSSLLLLTAGCAISQHGVSFESGQRRLEAIPGVETGRFSYKTLDQTFSSRPVLRVDVTAQTNERDPAELAEKIIRVAWAVGDKKPEGGLQVAIVSDPQVNFGEALQQAGWDSVTPSEANPSLFAVNFRGDSTELGKWPGELP
jgi:hypothetical protein